MRVCVCVCVCVVFLSFWCNWYLQYFDIIDTKSGPELFSVFIMISYNTFCFEVIFALVEIIFLVWCLTEPVSLVFSIMYCKIWLGVGYWGSHGAWHKVGTQYFVDELNDCKEVARYYISYVLLRGGLY